MPTNHSGRNYGPSDPKKYPRSITETTITAHIRKYLSDRGGVVIKMWGGGFQSPGIPDLYYAEKGVQVWFEVKKPDMKYGLTELQKHMIDLLKTQGVPVYVVTGVADVKAALKELGFDA